MAASFASASSQRLTNAAPPLVSTGYPLTVGVWARPTSTANTGRVFCYVDTGSASNVRLEIFQSTTGWRAGANDGAGNNDAIAAATVTANAWHFLLARFITATNRRFNVLAPDGSVTAANNTTNTNPTSLDTIALGCAIPSGGANSFFDGRIGELWYAQANILGQTGDLDARIVRQLAWGGPFSLPPLAPSILEYRSLRKHPIVGDGGDIYVGAGAGAQAWSNVNGVTVGPHPPLPYTYVNPRQRRVALPF